MKTSIVRFVAALAVAIMTASTSLAATLTALATFGGGDGWRAPNEIIAGDSVGSNDGTNYTYLRTGNNERGLSYNPTTGHLLLVSRNGGNNVRILDGATGADIGALSGASNATGGTFAVNMVDVAADGAIYVGNLSTSAASNFKVYRWGTESDAAPTTAHDAPSGVTRTGDSLAVFGSGAGTKIAAAGSNNVAASNFAVLNTSDGLTYAATAYTSIAGTTTATNDYRLSLSFVDADTLLGNQGTSIRVTDFAATATVAATIPVGIAQRSLDYAVIGGRPFVAVIDTGSSLLQVFDVSNPATPVLVASANNTAGALTANANGTGAVAFGNITGTGATIYAMSSNQGIQAFTFGGVPEPTSAALALIALLTGRGIRRRS